MKGSGIDWLAVVIWCFVIPASGLLTVLGLKLALSSPWGQALLTWGKWVLLDPPALMITTGVTILVIWVWRRR